MLIKRRSVKSNITASITIIKSFWSINWLIGNIFPKENDPVLKNSTLINYSNLLCWNDTLYTCQLTGAPYAWVLNTCYGKCQSRAYSCPWTNIFLMNNGKIWAITVLIFERSVCLWEIPITQDKIAWLWLKKSYSVIGIWYWIMHIWI